MTLVSGVGSWPGESTREAVVTVRDLLGEADGLGIPYLPELPVAWTGSGPRRALRRAPRRPRRRPPAVGLALHRPARRDLARTRSFWRQDLDELAEAYDGYAGPLKIQVAGPWTLAASIELNRGERSVTDEGARRDLVASLAEGVRQHVREVQRLVPGAVLTVQLDEPSVVSVLRGELPTASGYGRVRPVDRVEVANGIRAVREAHDGDVVLHSCHPDAPVQVLAATGVDRAGPRPHRASPQRWEALAEAVESGVRLWAGVVPVAAVEDSAGAVRRPRPGRRRVLARRAAGRLARRRHRHPGLRHAVAHAAGGRRRTRVTIDTARELTEKEQG